jgi:hypothetical protein
MTVKNLLRPLPGVRQFSLLRQQIKFRGSAAYWERNYADGGTSGNGSYGALAEGKAEFLNDFVRRRGVRSVIERCARRFAGDPAKSFFLYDGACFADNSGLFTADLAISLDVIYHLIEDSVFETYMTHLFAAGMKFVIIYATNRAIPGTAPHVRHRHFTSWVAARYPELQLTQVVEGPSSSPARADLYVYERASSVR